jgi:hypothetical protein
MPKKKVNGRIYGYRETCFERLIWAGKVKVRQRCLCA